MKKLPMSATELMAELRGNPEFAAEEQRRERHRAWEIKAARQAAAPIIAELAVLGFDVSSIAELPQKAVNYKRAVPVLMKWLPAVSNPSVKEMIVRALAMPFAESAASLLVEEFRRATPNQVALKWAIGSALEVMASEAVFEDLVELVRDKNHGKAREMLALALGNLSNPGATNVLIKLLDDEEVAGHAIIGLGKLRARAARRAIEHFLNHPKAWVRNEAKKALARIAQSRMH